MKLAELQVLHFDGATFPLTAAELAAAGGHGQAWGIATCPRTGIGAAGREARAGVAERPAEAGRAAGYTGAGAYVFLLPFAFRPASRLVGRSEIFRQIKESV